MKNKLTIIIICNAILFAVQTSFCVAQSQTKKIDQEKSSIEFTIKNLGVLTVSGCFNKFSGTAIITSNQLTTLESAIQVNSIETNDKERDKTLKSDSYLDAETFKTITFYSQEISNRHIIGILKIKDVEKQVHLPYKIDDSDRLLISTEINRKDFKLDFGNMDSLIGNTISISIKAAFITN